MPLASVARLSPRLLPMQDFHDVDVHHVGCAEKVVHIGDQPLHVVAGGQMDIRQIVAANLQHQDVDIPIHVRWQSASAQKT